MPGKTQNLRTIFGIWNWEKLINLAFVYQPNENTCVVHACERKLSHNESIIMPKGNTELATCHFTRVDLTKIQAKFLPLEA